MTDDALAQTAPDGGGGESRLLRLPKKSIQSEYLISSLLVVRTLDSVLADLKRLDDPRPRIIARQVINRILDDDIRYALLDKFDEKIQKINSGSGTTADEKAISIISCSQDFVGEVNSYFDEFFALHKGQEIGDV
jgi:hypothetical protein